MYEQMAAEKSGCINSSATILMQLLKKQATSQVLLYLPPFCRGLIFNIQDSGNSLPAHVDTFQEQYLHN